MGAFNFYNFNNKFYIFEDDEDFNNFCCPEELQKSKFVEEQKVFDNIGFVELVASSGYSYGGSLDYISLLDYFDYDGKKQNQKEYFHEFLFEIIDERDFGDIHKYTKENIVYMFISLLLYYEGINLNIALENYDLKQINWNGETKEDLKDFIIKVFDKMIKQDIQKAEKKLKHIAENCGAVYVERIGGCTVKEIK